jgi:hypothetical protein
MIALVSFSSCGNSSSPEAVALAFMKHVGELDFEAAAKLSDEKIQGFLTMAGSKKKEMQDKETPEEKAKRVENNKKLKSATCEVKGDKATCKLCCDLGSENESVDLIKKDGKWLVTIDKEKKEAKMKSGMDNMPAPVIETPEAPVVETPDSSTTPE